MSWRVPVSRFMIIAVVAACGCRGGGDDGGESQLLRSGDLVGIWGDGGEDLEFRSNGTFIDWSRDEAIWSIEDGMLSISYRVVLEDDGCTFTDEEGFSATAAIVDEILYIAVSVRSDGSGDGVDGTWEYREQEWGEATERCVGYTDSMWETEEYRTRITISGSTFESEEFNHEAASYGEENWDETWTETSSGSVRVDGDSVFVTVTERDGTPIPEDEQFESHLGFRVSPDVLVESSLGDDLDDYGYRRQ